MKRTICFLPSYCIYFQNSLFLCSFQNRLLYACPSAWRRLFPPFSFLTSLIARLRVLSKQRCAAIELDDHRRALKSISWAILPGFYSQFSNRRVYCCRIRQIKTNNLSTCYFVKFHCWSASFLIYLFRFLIYQRTNMFLSSYFRN